jgi:hypothetical protein
MNDIEELQDVIRRLHGSESTHLETVPVKETFQGQTVWEGTVEVFDLHDHPETSRVYAWTHYTDDADKPRRSVTVLHVPPATTPRKAVQVAIAGEYRERIANEQQETSS